MSESVVEGRVIEVAAGMGVDPVVTYADLDLDNTVSLKVQHPSGRLTAVVDKGIGEAPTEVDCGTVPPRLAALLGMRKKIFWTRMHEKDLVAAIEIDLIHV